MVETSEQHLNIADPFVYARSKKLFTYPKTHELEQT